jgi:hypothetical protein
MKMAFKILSPEEAKKRAKADIAKWGREKKIEKREVRIESDKAKRTMGKTKPAPDTIHEPSRIRGPDLEILITSAFGVSIESALSIAEAEKRIIASNLSLDRILVGSDRWRGIEDAFPCWTGTMTAYEEPGKKFGKTVEYVDYKTKIRYVFEVPSQYVGEKNAILVSEHPDYKLEMDGNNRIIRAAIVDLIEKFPAINGWYLADSKHGIPSENKVSKSNSNERYLKRKEKRVGPVARGYEDYVDFLGNFVYLNVRPSNSFGVAIVELPVSS